MSYLSFIAGHLFFLTDILYLVSLQHYENQAWYQRREKTCSLHFDAFCVYVCVGAGVWVRGVVGMHLLPLAVCDRMTDVALYIK